MRRLTHSSLRTTSTQGCGRQALLILVPRLASQESCSYTLDSPVRASGVQQEVLFSIDTSILGTSRELQVGSSMAEVTNIDGAQSLHIPGVVLNAVGDLTETNNLGEGECVCGGCISQWFGD